MRDGGIQRRGDRIPDVRRIGSQNPVKQRQCQAAGRGGTFSEGLAFQQITIKDGQGRASAWAGEAGTAVPRLSLG